MTNENNDYEVGYRKPPKNTQFKKGQSGNPKGRPKGNNDHLAIGKTIMKMFDSEISAKEGNKTVKMHKLEAFAAMLYSKAMSGNIQAAKLLLEIIKNSLEPELERIARIRKRKEFEVPKIRDAMHGAEIYKQFIKSLEIPRDE